MARWASFHGRRILVTGASSGIGRAIAERLAAPGVQLVLSGRDATRLEAAAAACARRGAQALGVVADLGRPGGVEAVVEAVASGPLDALVHAAGRGSCVAFARESDAEAAAVLTLNVLAPLRLTRALLPGLRTARGRVLFVGSVFGGLAFPFFATYSASKHALRGLSAALRRELGPAGVEVLWFAPRAMATPMSAPYAEVARRGGMKLDDPEAVAAKAVRALARGTPHFVVGVFEALACRLDGAFPGLLDGALRRSAAPLAGFARGEFDVAAPEPCRATRSPTTPRPASRSPS